MLKDAGQHTARPVPSLRMTMSSSEKRRGTTAAFFFFLSMTKEERMENFLGQVQERNIKHQLKVKSEDEMGSSAEHRGKAERGERKAFWTVLHEKCSLLLPIFYEEISGSIMNLFS